MVNEDDKNPARKYAGCRSICQRLPKLHPSLDVLPPQVLELRRYSICAAVSGRRLIRPDDTLCLHQLQPTAAVAGIPREPARLFYRTI